MSLYEPTETNVICPHCGTVWAINQVEAQKPEFVCGECHTSFDPRRAVAPTVSIPINPSLTLKQIKLDKEDTYFTIVAVFAALCWVAVAITIVGILYGLLIAFFIWLANGLVIAHLKSESVLVTPQQMPLLHRTYMEVVAKLELAETPPLYIVQAHGLLNAFATRRSGRHFVVVYSDMLEACGEDTAQIRFLLGHELGHVRSNHIIKKVILLPGLLYPLIGSAYSRACESTCDRYGAYAAGDLYAAAQAMLILAGGKIAWREMDPEVFSAQYKQERGFFVSWHELTSGYPTLSQRTYNLLMMDTLPQPVSEPRHPLAYLFALFSAGGRHGSGAGLLVGVAVIALLASIAVPAFTSVAVKSSETKSLNNERQIGIACIAYAGDNDDNFPPSLDALYPTYIPDRRVFISPLMPSDPNGYIYTPGLKNNAPHNTILIEDKYGPLKHVRIVEHVDGSTQVIRLP